MRYAVCNELFGRMPLRDAAAMTAQCGFHGLELAPFTVFGDFTAPAIARGIAETKTALQDNGLQFAGFHWLLTKPDGLHITTADAALRQKSWDHLRRLLDAAAELGGGNLVLGSPKQRSTPPGQTRAETIARLGDELAAIAPYAAERRSAILLEALSSDQTDVINLLSEVDAIVRRIDHPGVCGMFDFHNCSDETLPYAALIERHYAMIRHVHLNDPEGNAPCCGDANYHPAFATLYRHRYPGWVSLEIFSLPEAPLQILQQTMAYLKEVETMTK